MGAQDIKPQSQYHPGMRSTPWWVAGLALALCAQADVPDNKLTAKEMNRMLLEMMQWDSEWRKADHISRRAEALKPKRRDEPLRYLNITDEEVREVQLISAKYLPKVMVNISPVVTDCPCEEGPQCTAQVYVVASTQDDSKGLQLSRLKHKWMVGVVQQWWLRHDELQLHKPKPGAELTERHRYAQALHVLYSEFPRCVDKSAPATAELKK